MQSTSSTLSVVLVGSMRATRPGAEAGDAKVVDDYVGSKAAELEKKKRRLDGKIGTTLMGHSNIKLYGAPNGHHSRPTTTTVTANVTTSST